MNGINWSPNVDMLTVGEEGGEEEEVEYNDAFSVAIFWYFFLYDYACPLTTFYLILD